MMLLAHQRDSDALRKLASDGINMLATGQFELLVEHYGYAMAHGRNVIAAVEMDLARALAEVSGSKLLPVTENDLSVEFYQENALRLRAALDCEVPTEGGRNIWVSFVVFGSEAELSLSLEDISGEGSSD